MPKKPPSYLSNKSANGEVYARTKILWPGGRVEYRSLGIYGSQESHEAHQKAIAEWRAAWNVGTDPDSATVIRQAGTEGLAVADLCLRYWRHAQKRYVTPDGEPGGEQQNIRIVLRALRRTCGDVSLLEFGPKKLKTFREALIDGTWRTDAEKKRLEKRGTPLRMSRREVNRRVNIVRRIFRWAVSEELIPSSVADRLNGKSLPGLLVNEMGVREKDEVPPVPEPDLEKTLPELKRIIRAMVEIQLLTGCRPGEVLRLRPRDFQTTGTVEMVRNVTLQVGKCWVVTPKQHKTAHRNHRRILLFGPRAQEILAPFLANRNPDAYLFSPAEARREHYANLRAKRKTKVQPSQANRSKENPQHPPRDKYDKNSYNQAVKRACVRVGVPVWHVGQLRHNAATRLVAQFGWAVAQVVLGHRQVKTTQIYALEDLKSAAKAMEQMG